LFPFVIMAAPAASLAPAPSSLVDPAQLNRWIKTGYRTEKGERVVILDTLPNRGDRETWFAGNADALRKALASQFGADSGQVKAITAMDQKGLLGHIPGARLNISHLGLEVMDRSDGPLEVEHEVGSGQGIEKLLRSQGITSKDIVVLTSSQQNSPLVCAPRIWWTLSYWGFPPEGIKVLDGGNKAWVMAGGKLERGLDEPPVTPSAIRVPDAAARHLGARVGFEEMIQLVDSGRTTNGQVHLLDGRQPPVAFYLKDERKVDGTSGPDGTSDLFQVPGFQYQAEGKYFTRGGETTRFSVGEMLFSPGTVPPGSPVRAPFSGATNPPVDEANPFLTHAHLASPAGMEVPVALPLDQKPTAFDGFIRGAHLVKTATYDITLPALLGPDNRFKSREELRSLFAKAGIDGSRPVVIYCSTGALSSVYFFALQEICGFKNIRMYDGSWLEWGVLTAFQPADGTFVRKDPVLTYPAAPATQPAFWIFSGQNTYLEWDGKQFVSPGLTPDAVKQHLKLSAPLAGDLRWDTLHRSEHVVFKPTAEVNQPDRFQTYHEASDWPLAELSPDYQGKGDRIHSEDNAFTK
jgi:3-mercaptopyruvate sulfurtransferase SseA